MVDGSTFTVGPGSDLVIDKFVYDPRKGTGQITASFSKGVMRFVGGKLSKNDGGVTIDTPAGALALRGGIAFVDFKQLQGKTIYEPGYGFFSNNGQLQTKPFTAADVKAILAALTNSHTGGVGNANDNPKPNTVATLFSTQNLNQLIHDATTESIITQAKTAEQNQQPDPGCPPNCPPPDPDPQPIPVNVRVLASPGVYTAFPGLPGWTFTTDNGGENGILGGGSYQGGVTPDLAADDFIWTFGILDGRLLGEIVGLTDANCDQGNCENIVNHPVSPDPIVDFPRFEPGDCEPSGVCQITAASNATVTQDGERTYEGYAVRKDGFFPYHVVGEHPEDGADRILLFGGEKYSFAETSAGTLYKFELTEDMLQSDAFGPFASDDSSPIAHSEPGLVSTDQGRGFVSPLLLLDTGTTADQGQGGVWLQANLFLGSDDNGESFNGESFINIALGQWNETDGLTGARRGGSSVAGENPQDYSFSGDIARLAGPDSEGALPHIMGTENPNIVIGFDSTGTHNVGRDNPLNPPEGARSRASPARPTMSASEPAPRTPARRRPPPSKVSLRVSASSQVAASRATSATCLRTT